LRDRELFHNPARISGKTDRIFMKMLSEMYRRTRKCPLDFGRRSGLESCSASGLQIKTLDPNWIHLGGGLYALRVLFDKCSTVIVKLKLFKNVKENH